MAKKEEKLTEKEKLKIISELLKLYEEDQINSLQEEPSILQIFGREYDEDLISRMLAYALKNDKDLVWRLLIFYGAASGSRPNNFEIKSVKCEKTMLNGRADVFIEAKSNDNKYTLTIENKILSWEHNDQTQTYYQYVKNYYNNCQNAYLFLRPDYNISPISCDKFKSISYNELLEKISDVNDYRIHDLKKHIEEYLGVKKIKFEKVDRQVLSNLQELRVILDETEKKLTDFKNSFFAKLCNGAVEGLEYNPYEYERLKKQEKNTKKQEAFNYMKKYKEGNALVVDLDDSTNSIQRNNSFRIYRANEWKFEDGEDKDKYFFYVEMIFRDNDPNNIQFQATLKRDDKTDISIVTKFIDYINHSNLPIALKGQWDEKYNNYYIFSKKVFSSDSDEEMLSDKWQEELFNFASTTLNEYIKEMKKIFNSFKEWKENNKVK